MLSRNSVTSASSYKAFNKRPYSSIYEEEVSEELGAETEAEKHLKVLLQKQLNTKLSFQEQFSQHRTFSCPSTYNAPSELMKGTCTLDKFLEVEKNEELHQQLQRCGLTEDEISDYFAFHSKKKKSNYNVDPGIWAEKIKSIEDKINAHDAELLKPQAFKNVKKLTRHEMEIEKSLYAGCPEKSKLATLVSVLEDSQPLEMDSAFKHIKNLSEKLLHPKKKNRKTNKINESSVNDNKCIEDESNFQYDSNIHHVIVPLEESDVEEKRLSIDDIKKLPRFQNYEIGSPAKEIKGLGDPKRNKEGDETLYIKNLHPKVTAYELRSLFGGFQEDNNSPIEYKICTGRMKGQAFVKFSDEVIAEKALKHANGYSLRGKPMIIEFGRKS